MLIKNAKIEKEADFHGIMNAIPHAITAAGHVAGYIAPHIAQAAKLVQHGAGSVGHSVAHVAQVAGKEALDVTKAAGSGIGKLYNGGLDLAESHSVKGALMRESLLTAAPTLAVGSTVKILPKVLLRPGNPLSGALSRTGLADGIVALKKAGEGKSMSTDTLLGMMAHGGEMTQAKTLALSGFNKDVLAHPFISKAIFKKDRPNLLDVSMIERNMRHAGDFKELLNHRLAEAQTRVVNKAKKDIGLFTSSEDAAMHIANRLERYNQLSSKIADPAREFLTNAEHLHKEFSEHGRNGYKLLRGAAAKAETSLSRPIMNIQNRVYQDVNKPSRGPISMTKNLIVGEGLGQRKPTGLGFVDYLKNGHPKDRISPEAQVFNKRVKVEDKVVARLNKSPEAREFAGNGIIPDKGGEYTHENVIEGIRSGTLRGRAKELINEPVTDNTMAKFLNKLHSIF